MMFKRVLRAKLPTTAVKHASRTGDRRRRRGAVTHHPVLLQLEERRLLSCSYPEPWCLDGSFASASGRHASLTVAGHSVLGRATHLQTVAGEERILIAGTAIDPSDPTNPKYVIARLCADGSYDNGVNCGAGEDNGFGFHGISGTDPAPGYLIKDFLDTGSGPFPDNERIDSIGIQPDVHSSFCDGPDPNDKSDKIVVSGRVLKNGGPVWYVWGVMRLCANGEIDTSFGGQPRDYDVLVGQTSDEPGTVTVAHANGSSSWTRDSEPFDMAIEPGTNKIVLGGYAVFPPPPNPRVDEFALARLCENGKYDNGDLGGVPGNCGSIGFGTNDDDPGRIRFDGFKSSTGTYVDNDRTNSRIYGIELVPTLDDDECEQYDILIAGQTRDPTQNQTDFFVARVKHDGDKAHLSTSTQFEPFYWKKTIDFAYPDDRDDFAFDMAYSKDEDAVIVVGVTCPLGSCANLDTDPSQQSDIAFAILDAEDGDIDSKERVDGGSDEFADTYSDVAYSVVLLGENDDDDDQGDNDDQGEDNDDQGDNGDGCGDDEFFVIGGYSVDMDGGASYMSGARFEFDDPDEDEYDFFRSDFANSTGDQVRELQVQDDNRIVAGGFHNETGASTFAAIRLCQDPDDTCNQTNAPSSGDGGSGGLGSGWLGVGQDAARAASSSTDQQVAPMNSTSWVSNVLESPAPVVVDDGSEAPAPQAPDVGRRQVLMQGASPDDVFDSPLDSTSWDGLG